MAEAKDGDRVKVFYIGRLEDGTVFDLTPESEPVQFRIGDGSMLQGFEEAVVGMIPGDVKTVSVPAQKAYGLRKEGMTVEFRRDRVPEGLELGDIIGIKLPSGREANLVVIAVTDDKVALDANHPLAGRDLIFDIELVEVTSGP